MSQSVEKKAGGKSGKATATAASMSEPQVASTTDRKHKKRPFVKDGHYSVSKVRHNIKRVIKTNPRFASNTPSISEAGLNVFATIALDLAHQIAVCAGELAKKVGKNTVGADEISAAFKIELGGELLNLCEKHVQEMVKKSGDKKARAA